MLTGTVAKIHWQPRSEQSLCDHPLAGVAMVQETLHALGGVMVIKF